MKELVTRREVPALQDDVLQLSLREAIIRKPSSVFGWLAFQRKKAAWPLLVEIMRQIAPDALEVKSNSPLKVELRYDAVFLGVTGSLNLKLIQIYTYEDLQMVGKIFALALLKERFPSTEFEIRTIDAGTVAIANAYAI